MRSFRKVIFLFLMTLSIGSQAENHMLILGGGGEPAGKSTMFDNELPLFAKISESWKTKISFNGGHEKTEKIIQEKFGQRGIETSSFTEDAFEKNIKALEEKISTGEISPGDQLMVFISTHGAMKNNSEATHQVALAGSAVTNFSSLQGTKVVSLDKLKKLTELADAKGIKLALIDMSCHSGNTLALANKSTCVISGSGPDHYGYSGSGFTFNHRFMKNMKKGKSLEAAFLDAREDYWDNAFPMISSPVGISINEDLYKPLTPYLFEFEKEGQDKFSPRLKAEAEKGDACEMPEEFDALMSVIRQAEEMKEVSKVARLSGGQANRLRKAYKEYYDFWMETKKKYADLLIPGLKEKESFCTKFTIGEGRYRFERENCWNYSLEEILSADHSWSKEYYKKMADGSGSLNATYAAASLSNLEKIEKRKEEILKVHPQLKKLETFFQDQAGYLSKSKSLAREVAWASQHLYRALYHQRSIENKETNPCKDFIL
jgi:hypothetical protein